jgi:hypothetical protein
MALIGSLSLIRALGLFHIALAYFMLTSPETLGEQNIVLLLGEAMHLVRNCILESILLEDAANTKPSLAPI